MPETTTLRTPLYDLHVAAGAKMVDFAGWDMPVQYSGITKEHEAVRTSAGLFDLSHMGEVWVRGSGAFAYLQGLVTNDLNRIETGKALYACMCRPDGTVLDDMVIYRFEKELLVVMNASNREKIVAWMEDHKPAQVELEDKSMETALIALQGPKAQEILQPLVDLSLEDVRYYAAAWGTVQGVKALISRTGYTGEDGFELYVDWNDGPAVWKALAPHAEPIGLGARDTLRLESGYALYGHELDETVTPYDAGLGWVVKLDKDFLGRDALRAQKEAGLQKTLVGLMMEGRAIPREGYPVYHNNRQVGRVTSGTFSPSLKKGIALASVEAVSRAEGTEVSVEVRGRHEPARVSRPPFVRGSVRKG